VEASEERIGGEDGDHDYAISSCAALVP
jgi:hypothetical protein